MWYLNYTDVRNVMWNRCDTDADRTRDGKLPEGGRNTLSGKKADALKWIRGVWNARHGTSRTCEDLEKTTKYPMTQTER